MDRDRDTKRRDPGCWSDRHLDLFEGDTGNRVACRLGLYVQWNDLIKNKNNINLIFDQAEKENGNKK